MNAKRCISTNFSIPYDVLEALDKECGKGKRSAYVTEVLRKALKL
jgi:hypothetical protein